MNTTSVKFKPPHFKLSSKPTNLSELLNSFGAINPSYRVDYPQILHNRLSQLQKAQKITTFQIKEFAAINTKIQFEINYNTNNCTQSILLQLDTTTGEFTEIAQPKLELLNYFSALKDSSEKILAKNKPAAPAKPSKLHPAYEFIYLQRLLAQSQAKKDQLTSEIRLIWFSGARLNTNFGQTYGSTLTKLLSDVQNHGDNQKVSLLIDHSTFLRNTRLLLKQAREFHHCLDIKFVEELNFINPELKQLHKDYLLQAIGGNPALASDFYRLAYNATLLAPAVQNAVYIDFDDLRYMMTKLKLDFEGTSCEFTFATSQIHEKAAQYKEIIQQKYSLSAEQTKVVTNQYLLPLLWNCYNEYAITSQFVQDFANELRLCAASDKSVAINVNTLVNSIIEDSAKYSKGNLASQYQAERNWQTAQLTQGKKAYYYAEIKNWLDRNQNQVKLNNGIAVIYNLKQINPRAGVPNSRLYFDLTNQEQLITQIKNHFDNSTEEFKNPNAVEISKVFPQKGNFDISTDHQIIANGPMKFNGYGKHILPTKVGVASTFSWTTSWGSKLNKLVTVLTENKQFSHELQFVLKVLLNYATIIKANKNDKNIYITPLSINELQARVTTSLAKSNTIEDLLAKITIAVCKLNDFATKLGTLDVNLSEFELSLTKSRLNWLIATLIQIQKQITDNRTTPNTPLFDTEKFLISLSISRDAETQY